MSDWFPRKITDYWDSIPNAIHSYAINLTKLDETARQAALVEIQNGLKEHVRVLTDDNLHLATLCMVDDLYKSVSTDFVLDQSLLDYLEASAGSFSRLLCSRGYIIHYIVDNIFVADELHMRGPLDAFPAVFRSAGFKYICPQYMAMTMMKTDEVDLSQYYLELPRYIAEARDVCNMILKKCHENGYHYFFLDTDSVPDSFEFAFAEAKKPGVITIFRDEAPVKGSRATAFFPETKKGQP